MSDQYRDSFVSRQSKNRGKEDPIRVSFFDKDGLLVNDITRKEANAIAAVNPQQLFYFQDADGYRRELLINEVNQLTINDATVPSTPACPSNPQLCGPPKVRFFGGGGFGAMANSIISPNSSSVIGFDIVNPGFNYLTTPFATLEDECGSGSGGSLLVQTQPVGTSSTNVGAGSGKSGLEIKNVVITAPGDGYLPAPNGSLGGNGRIWKDVNDGYVQKEDGTLYVVPGGAEPSDLQPGDVFIPPQPPPPQPTDIYPVVTEIEEVYIYDPGFGYQSGDTIIVDNNVDGKPNGAILEPVIDDRGEIIRVNIINPGIGFIDLPIIKIISPTGYNAKLIPVLKVIPLNEIPDPTTIPSGTPLISVVDCVGRIAPKSTFDIIPR